MILHPYSFLQDIKIQESDLAFLAYEGQKTKSLSEQIKQNFNPAALFLCVGREGGFSEQEVKEFSSQKNVSVFL